jgi:cytochrome c-type biogenesis protein CcmH/NrfG
MMETDRALAPLNAASAAIDRLDTYRTPQELAESLQAIGQAVERALRQLLRSDTTAPDELRLAALSPDELPIDRLIPALRKNDVISIPLAGMLHELMQAAARASDNDVRASDADNARAAVRRLREDVQAHNAAAPAGTTAVSGDVRTATRADASMRDAATNAIRRGDIEETPHTVSPNRKSIGARAALPIVLLALVALIIWGVMHFLMGGASAMNAGVTAFEAQRWGVAEQNFRAVISDHPKDVTARLYLGRVLRVEGRAKEAGQVLNDARKLAPKDADVLRELGGAFMDMNTPGAAVTAYRQAQELDPSNAANWVGLVRALRAAGDPSAEQVLQQAPAEAQAALRSRP